MIYLFSKKKCPITGRLTCGSRLNGFEIIGTGKIRIILFIYMMSISLQLLFVQHCNGCSLTPDLLVLGIWTESWKIAERSLMFKSTIHTGPLDLFLFIRFSRKWNARSHSHWKISSDFEFLRDSTASSHPDALASSRSWVRQPVYVCFS